MLKRELEAVTADVVVSPTSESEVRTILAAAYKLGIPVTPRGAGTGNYGQAMPLMGGVLLNLAEMNKIRSIERGRVICEPGALLIDVDKACEASGQELRMFPSTRGTASVAGFVAGGSGGVGSITWGGLRDFGNVLRLRVMTLEAEPRTLELTGEDLHKAVHAYGTNGIITEVEMPLTAHYDWVNVIVGFDSFDAATAYALALGEQDGILKKLVTVVAGPTPHDYFLRHRALIPARRQRRHSDDRSPCARRFRSLYPALQGCAYSAQLEPRGPRDARRLASQLRTDLESHHAARVTGRSRASLTCRSAIPARARSV